jgi:hypothetical protein
MYEVSVVIPSRNILPIIQIGLHVKWSRLGAPRWAAMPSPSKAGRHDPLFLPCSESSKDWY